MTERAGNTQLPSIFRQFVFNFGAERQTMLRTFLALCTITSLITLAQTTAKAEYYDFVYEASSDAKIFMSGELGWTVDEVIIENEFSDGEGERFYEGVSSGPLTASTFTTLPNVLSAVSGQVTVNLRRSTPSSGGAISYILYAAGYLICDGNNIKSGNKASSKAFFEGAGASGQVTTWDGFGQLVPLTGRLGAAYDFGDAGSKDAFSVVGAFSVEAKSTIVY